jgi:D-sedoheptulose 7-phosphate isomerase
MTENGSLKFLEQFARQNLAAVESGSSTQQLIAVERAGDLLAGVLLKGGLIVSAGNGGSMADAMHLAEELSGKYRDVRPALRAVALSDPTYITCVGNDFGFDQIFARGCEALLREGDVAVLYSTSGSSQNILAAARYCLQSNIRTIGVTGALDSALEKLVTVCLTPAINLPTEGAQLVHTMWTHMLIELVERKLGYVE